MTIAEAIKNGTSMNGRIVTIDATYRGYQPMSDPNIRDGPPITKSDWAIGDSTGCMYVTGTINLDPEKDIGTKIVVTGILRKTPNGQVYLVLKMMTISRLVTLMDFGNGTILSIASGEVGFRKSGVQSPNRG